MSVLAQIELISGLLLITFGFWVGAIPFGVVIGRARGVDVQVRGSGNIGATNVARTVGKKAGIVVLVLDALKGAVPILAWLYVVDPQPGGWWLVAVGLSPILGHCFSPWLRLRGGKGVATALGVFLALTPLAAGVGVATFAVVYALFRVASLGSMIGAVAIAIATALRYDSRPALVLAIAAAALIILRHRGNLTRLLKRSELRV